MNYLAWLDLEMTGLDVQQNTIIEIATVITDVNLNVIAQGPDLIVNQPQEIMTSMDDWNTKQHNSSGLTAKVLASRINMAQAEIATLEFLQQHIKADEAPLCGNSIGQDRKFLEKYMPELAAFFHYRSLDVSSLKIVMQNWYQEVPVYVKKSDNHRALADIIDSINECKYYKQVIDGWLHG